MHSRCSSMTTAVAAAASVPSSSTSMNALCTTSLMASGSSVMPLKSALPLNARPTPSWRSVSPSREATSIRNFGSRRSTW